jgi:tRNA-splicing ligase RtcB
MITGNDFLALGLKPGKWFKEALEYINTQALEGEALHAYLDTVKPAPVIPLLAAPVAFHENIRADTAVEQANIDYVRQSMQLLMRTPTVVGGAIMPDACPAGPMGTIPVGGVVATRNAIPPGMHSADICCSVMLTNLGKADPKTVLDVAQGITHFGPGGRDADKQFPLPPEILAEMQANPFLNSERSLKMAREHLGTQGDGNHFLYVGVSKNTGDTMLVTHHGSRGVGAVLYDHGMKVAEFFRRDISPDTAPANARRSELLERAANRAQVDQAQPRGAARGHCGPVGKACAAALLERAQLRVPRRRRILPRQGSHALVREVHARHHRSTYHSA